MFAQELTAGTGTGRINMPCGATRLLERRRTHGGVSPYEAKTGEEADGSSSRSCMHLGATALCGCLLQAS